GARLVDHAEDLVHDAGLVAVIGGHLDGGDLELHDGPFLGWLRRGADRVDGGVTIGGQALPVKLTRSPRAHHNRAPVMAPSSLYLVTGGAGFIGSHVVERLLSQGHRVRVLDNFSTGSRANLDFAKGNGRLEVIRGDLKSLTTVERAVRGVTAVFHQAAMRSVPRSVADPL